MNLFKYERLSPIKLDEETHKYIINLPSVSSLVEIYWPFMAQDIPPIALKKGIEKGTCVHNLISEYIKTGSHNQCPHNVSTHISALKWLIEVVNGLDMVEKVSEMSLISFSKGFTGTFDLLYKDSEGQWTLLDFKTTAKTHTEKEGLQLSLYAELVKENFGLEVNNFKVINTTSKIIYNVEYDKEHIKELFEEE